MYEAAADAAAKDLLDAWNAEASVKFHGEQTHECLHCGRTFSNREKRDAHCRRCDPEAQKEIDDRLSPRTYRRAS